MSKEPTPPYTAQENTRSLRLLVGAADAGGKPVGKEFGRYLELVGEVGAFQGRDDALRVEVREEDLGVVVREDFLLVAEDHVGELVQDDLLAVHL